MNISWQAEMAIYRLGSKNVYGEAQLQFVRKTNVGVVKLNKVTRSHRYVRTAPAVAVKRIWNCSMLFW